MARRGRRVGTAYSRKIKDAAHLLFFQHHRLPGVRGWELRQELGNEYLDVIDVLDDQLKPLDLKVTKVLEELEAEDPTRAQLADARFYVTLRGTVDQKTAKTIGWRIDDIAGLAVTVAFIISKQGKAPRREIEGTLAEKLPGWRAKMNIDRYIEEGYIGEDERKTLYLDWRSRAEIDQKQLVDMVLRFGKRPERS